MSIGGIRRVHRSRLGAISEYWIETRPNEFGVEWLQPDEFIAYYPPEQEGPEFGGGPVGPVDAVYCYQGDSDFIAWDEPGLMLPFHEQFGDMADAVVVLAHEFRRGAQARLGLSDQFPLTIEAELQADDFAGAWAAWADEQGLLGRDAADQTVDAVVSVAEPEGVPWNDPQAHGTAEERLTAFADGFDGGAGDKNRTDIPPPGGGPEAGFTNVRHHRIWSHPGSARWLQGQARADRRSDARDRSPGARS